MEIVSEGSKPAAIRRCRDILRTLQGERQAGSHGMSCSFQKENFVCGQKETGLEDWTMEQNGGFGFWIWGVAKVIDVAIGT